MKKIVSKITARLVHPRGVETRRLKAGEECVLSDEMYGLYVERTGDKETVPDTGDDTSASTDDTVVANTAPTQTDEQKAADERLLLIASAITEIQAEGDASKMTVDNVPKVSVLEKVLGFNISSDERDAAFEMV